jgi:diguanylate cyclase (GGDEF)-like protein
MELSRIYYAQNCLVGLIILGLIYFSFRRVRDRRLASHTVFAWMFLPVLMNLLLEPALGLISGRPGPAFGVGVRVVVVLFYVLQPVPMALWMAYLYSILRETRPERSEWLLLVLPFAVNLVITVASLWLDFTFEIDENNTYHRGAYYVLLPGVCYSYLAFYLYYAIRKRNQMLNKEFKMFLFAVLPTALAGIVQTLFYGITAIWLGSTFTLMILYLNLVVHQANTDGLTGLANRRRFSSMLETAFTPEGRKTPISMTLVDIDNFKCINDVHGHVTGDRVLEAVGDALRRSARKDDLVARIGGDEFALLAEVHEPKDMNRIAERVRENLCALNQKRLFPFEIKISVGCGRCDDRENLTPSAFFELIDNRLYDEKRVNHRGLGYSQPQEGFDY